MCIRETWELHSERINIIGFKTERPVISEAKIQEAENKRIQEELRRKQEAERLKLEEEKRRQEEKLLESEKKKAARAAKFKSINPDPEPGIICHRLATAKFIFIYKPAPA